MSIENTLAKELKAQPKQVVSAIELLDSGASVPFIARYRKEATGGLDDTQLRQLEEKLTYYRGLDERRATILKSIESQDQLSDKLRQQILAANTKQQLEDLYLPFRPKRKSKGKTAIQAGLQPLADELLSNPSLNPEIEARKYINTDKNVPDSQAALDGAKAILTERFSEMTELVSELRNFIRSEGYIISKVKKDKEKDGAKFQDYFDFNEKINKIPSHRALAIFRGRKSNILDVSIDILLEDEQTSHPAILKIQAFNDWTHQDRAADKWLSEVFTWTWKVKLQNQLQNELLSEIKELADTESIKVFAQNLSNLLMSAPAGEKNTLGLDPGLRTGVKVAAVDDTGKLLSHTTIFPHAPKNEWDASIETLNKLCQTHNIKLISIGNGTASRETENLVKELKAKYPDWGYQGVVVSEAGASVYSASAYAAKEFPDLDVSFRGAVSIARRLQDPLAELVKIEPKSIGVGQYQHDVNQRKLSRNLDTVVEDCVNSVGVDVNTASVALLSRISGLNTTIAGNIVNYRDKHGRFKNREALKKIPRFGNKTFEQAAGFLRLKNGDHPLDQSGVHPESYKLVESIAEKYNKALDLIIGDSQFLAKISPEEFANEQFGLPTIKDILTELEKPGRDPRPEFKTANFSSDVNTIDDLKSGMILEGVISNVTNFGAFVNVGVHQDGLVHISALSSNFVKDPHQIVKAGDIVKVKVLEVDQSLKRISLTMKLNEEAKQDISKPSRNKIKPEKKNPPPKAKQQTKKKTKEKSGTAFDKKGAKPALPPGKTGTFADLFANAMNKDNKH